MPRRSASSGADNSAIPKLPAGTQKIVNDIVTNTSLSDQDKGNQLNQVLSPLGLAWSGRDKTIVRKPSFGGGAKGTVPSMTSAPVGQDATVSPAASHGASAAATTGPAAYDKNGTAFYKQPDGSFQDANGNTYGAS
jgi:hypothetical protein